jgi:hypothetical protein
MKKLWGLILFFTCLFVARPVWAASILTKCAETGRCTLCDIVQTGINFGIFLFGIVGALVLLFFFYGGFMMLISGGSSEKVKKGKDILVNATIGLFIVFAAYTGVNFIVSTITGGWDWAGNLKCAPLPAPVGWEAPSESQGAGPGKAGGLGGTAPAGTIPGDTSQPTPPVDTTKACKTTADCPNGWCDNITEKCAEKKADGETCLKAYAKGGEANDICKSGKCDETQRLCQTASGKKPLQTVCAKADECDSGVCGCPDATKCPGPDTNVCVPKDGTGENGVFCNGKTQCKSGFCDDFRIGGALPGNNPDNCDNKGMCEPLSEMRLGRICNWVNLINYNNGYVDVGPAPCAAGSCQQADPNCACNVFECACICR